MASITLRVLEGTDRGKVYDNLPLPVSIGREEGNTIQLNDDRVSRYHLKIQMDHENLVLTDLESTNGTRVNGEDTHLKILRFGDVINLGRTSLLVGTREQISQRLAKLGRPDLEKQLAAASSGERSAKSPWQNDPNYSLSLLADEPPQLPVRMSPGQSAHLSELLDFLYMHLRRLIGEGTAKQRGDQVELPQAQWQQLLDLQARVAELLRKIGRG
ncbi:MAG: FHA domain-containing protein [Planctomycetota bacterium]